MRIRKLIICGFILLLSFTAFAQSVSTKIIEDSVIGWMRMYRFKKPREGRNINGRFYSASQLAVTDSFATWIQASYMPKGGLGDIIRIVNDEPGPYNPNDGALPQSYGVTAKTYTDLRFNSNHKLEPLTTDHLPWSIVANFVYGRRATLLNTPTQFYFTLPSFEEQGFGKENEKLFDLSSHPLLKKFPSYYQRNSVTGNQKILLLCKNYEFPFVKITKGEYLQVMEAAVMRLYKTEKEEIYNKYSGNQKSIDYSMGYLEDKNTKRMNCLKANKERYKDRLTEIAEVFQDSPDAMLENYSDIFEGEIGASRLKLPVYKVDPKRLELCKKDQPQWIVITWTPEIGDPVGKQLHEAVINNFNFEYCYNYFFDPEKVKGKPYQPLRSPFTKEKVAVTPASSATNAAVADKNVFFFEDFSIKGEGQKPIGWYDRLNLVG